MKSTVIQLSLSLLLLLSTACEKKEEKQAEEAKKTETEAKVSETPAAESTPAVPQGEQAKVVAEFPDGKKITMGQVYDQLNLLPPEIKDRPFSKLYAALLRRLIDTQILNKSAADLGLDKSAEVISLMDKNSETMLQKIFV